jgi:hypothetical protein
LMTYRRAADNKHKHVTLSFVESRVALMFASLIEFVHRFAHSRQKSKSKALAVRAC